MQKLLEINQLFPYIIHGIGIFTGIHFYYRNKDEAVKMKFIYFCCFIAIAVYIVYTFLQYKRGLDILTLLPFQLCYISIIWMPLILSKKNKAKFFLDFLFYTSSLGASMAIFLPATDFIDGTWSFISYTFFLYHFILMAIPIWLFLWKLYTPNITVKGCIQMFFSLSVLTSVIHLFNLFLVKIGVSDANYFLTMHENASKQHVVLALVTSIIPYDLIYILVLGTPILFAYIIGWNILLYIYENQKNPKLTKEVRLDDYKSKLVSNSTG